MTILTPQPAIQTEYQLLKVAYELGDLKLDLFGEVTEFGYEVADAALSGTKVSLYDIMSVAQLETMSNWCNDHLPAPAVLKSQHRDQARAEMFQYFN